MYFQITEHYACIYVAIWLAVYVYILSYLLFTCGYDNLFSYYLSFLLFFEIE